MNQITDAKVRGFSRSRGQSRGQVINLFPKDENRETEVNRDFRFFVTTGDRPR